MSILHVGGLQLVAAADALAFLEACASSNVRILGVESFRQTYQGVKSDIDGIADFSAIDDPARSVAEAGDFVRNALGPGLAFEFVIE